MVLLRCSCSLPSQGLKATGKCINVSPSPAPLHRRPSGGTGEKAALEIFGKIKRVHLILASGRIFKTLFRKFVPDGAERRKKALRGIVGKKSNFPHYPFQQVLFASLKMVSFFEEWSYRNVFHAKASRSRAFWGIHRKLRRGNYFTSRNEFPYILYKKFI